MKKNFSILIILLTQSFLLLIPLILTMVITLAAMKRTGRLGKDEAIRTNTAIIFMIVGML